ncbi:MAG: hypothetical protein K6B44_04615 [Lachnospiraceae bacterium]|nr:hypothetical protein [Lachnospiraceae bacterium]
MKNQYVADIGDYGKYALLRAFAREGVKIGVNWYLTEDDGSSDGKFTYYLDKKDLRWYEPELFDVLKKINRKKTKSVLDIQKYGVIPNSCFYNEIIKTNGKPAERKKYREEWFEKSMYTLSKADLIFSDPDNGLLEKNDATAISAKKYVLPLEIERMFNAGHNVVYYCHKGRRKLFQWHDYLSVMFERIDGAKPVVLTFHKGTQRSYVFMIHEKDFVQYRKIIDSFHSKWYPLFTEEYTNKGDVTRKTAGEPFMLKRGKSDIVTIQEREDDKFQIYSSDDPSTFMIMDADMICDRLMS